MTNPKIESPLSSAHPLVQHIDALEAEIEGLKAKLEIAKPFEEAAKQDAEIAALRASLGEMVEEFENDPYMNHREGHLGELADCLRCKPDIEMIARAKALLEESAVTLSEKLQATIHSRKRFDTRPLCMKCGKKDRMREITSHLDTGRWWECSKCQNRVNVPNFSAFPSLTEEIKSLPPSGD